MNGTAVSDGCASTSKSDAPVDAVVFSTVVYCGEGGRPSVALADERIAVLVHEGQGDAELHHCVGMVGEEGTVEWGNRRQCAKGVNPSVAANDVRIVVEVHENQWENRLWCKYGIVNPDTKELTWSQSQFYGRGTQPTVALRMDGRLVEMHEEKHRFKKHLCYRLGQLDIENQCIRWEESVKIGKGKNPSVAVSDEGVVLEMHENDSDNGLCYTVGELRESHIEWGEVQQYDVGIAPCVCIRNWSNQVLVVHQDATSETLYYHGGLVNLKDRVIDWQPGKHNTMKGKSPGIAIGNSGVMVGVQIQGGSSMACVVGSIPKLHK